MTEKRLFLIRHGETAWSLSGQHTGKTDIPLTAKGEEQAAALNNRIHNHPFSSVFCSPMQRAQKTCQLCGLSNKMQISPLLCEWNYGDYEGLTSPAIHNKHPGWDLFKEGAPHGESPEAVTKRVLLFFKQIEPLQGDIALFAHGHILRSIALLWTHLPLNHGSSLDLSTASLSIVGYTKGVRVIQLWNDTSHIKASL